MSPQQAVIEAAAKLVWKITACELRGDPVRTGKDGPGWSMEDGYPAEYTALVDALEELSVDSLGDRG
jgi:hypothetical protein